jgi:hypothetical protein
VLMQNSKTGLLALIRNGPATRPSRSMVTELEQKPNVLESPP